MVQEGSGTWLWTSSARRQGPSLTGCLHKSYLEGGRTRSRLKLPLAKSGSQSWYWPGEGLLVSRWFLSLLRQSDRAGFSLPSSSRDPVCGSCPVRLGPEGEHRRRTPQPGCQPHHTMRARPCSTGQGLPAFFSVTGIHHWGGKSKAF